MCGSWTASATFNLEYVSDGVLRDIVKQWFNFGLIRQCRKVLWI